jgi:hypothetical protein
MEAEHGDVLCYTEVRWLSEGKVLNRVLELKYQIGEFMASKENLFLTSMILSG